MEASDNKNESLSGIAEKQKIVEPCKYKVILYNDDYTTKDFVVSILKDVFNKSLNDAVVVMESVHTTGKGVAGIYYYDIAMTKIKRTMELARKNDFPLRCGIEGI